MVYLVGRKHAEAALAIARMEERATVILLHDAVYLAPPGLRNVYARKADVEARGIRPMGRLIDDAEIVSKMMAEPVVSHA